MIHRIRRSQSSLHQANGTRPGLAPLELVLNLPIMLFVMALMMLIGTGGAWKARTDAVARQAAWRAFAGRLSDSDPLPDGWPDQATMTEEASQPSVLPDDPWLSHEVVRGPALTDPNTGMSLPVREHALDLTSGLRQGRAELVRPFPIFRRLPPHEFSFRRLDVVLDGSRWQFHTMQMGSNLARRVLWTYVVDYQLQFADVTDAFIVAALAVLESFDSPMLKPLVGGDPDVAELGFGRSPDFRPGINVGQRRARIPALGGAQLRPMLCEIDLEAIQRDQVLRLLASIDAVPLRMTDYYLGIYRAKIDELENHDPAQPGDAALIAQLENYVRQLQRFRATLVNP